MPGNVGCRDWSFPPVLIPTVFTHYPGKGIPGEFPWDDPAEKLCQGLIPGNPGKFVPMGIPGFHLGDGIKEFHPVLAIPGMDPCRDLRSFGKRF